jgi:outer membrane protein assembly factor BamE (lipoprotein component of BamABCDE complex)
MTFFFSDEVLVGHHFLSSFKSDSSDFDDSKVSHIVKGKTTRAEVVRLLGKPVGFYIEPMVKSTAGQAIGYRYVTYKRAPFSEPKRFQKVLTVSFDSADVVSDVVFSRTEDVSAVSTPSAPPSPPGKAQDTNRNYQFRAEGAKEAHIPQRGWSDCVALPCPGAEQSGQK